MYTRDLGVGFFDGVQDMPAPGKLTLRALAPLYVIPISDPLVHGNFDRHGRNLFPTFCPSFSSSSSSSSVTINFLRQRFLLVFQLITAVLEPRMLAPGLDRSSPNVMPILESNRGQNVQEKRKFC